MPLTAAGKTRASTGGCWVKAGGKAMRFLRPSSSRNRIEFNQPKTNIPGRDQSRAWEKRRRTSASTLLSGQSECWARSPADFILRTDQ